VLRSAHRSRTGARAGCRARLRRLQAGSRPRQWRYLLPCCAGWLRCVWPAPLTAVPGTRAPDRSPRPGPLVESMPEPELPVGPCGGSPARRAGCDSSGSGVEGYPARRRISVHPNSPGLKTTAPLQCLPCKSVALIPLRCCCCDDMLPKSRQLVRNMNRDSWQGQSETPRPGTVPTPSRLLPRWRSS
jgi:hypothetical protein